MNGHGSNRGPRGQGKAGSGRPGGGRPGAGRRPPPPESTGIEARYLEQQRDAARPVRIVMQDEGTIEGVVREFERDVLVVEPEIGDPVRIRKSGIRYIEEKS